MLCSACGLACAVPNHHGTNWHKRQLAPSGRLNLHMLADHVVAAVFDKLEIPHKGLIQRCSIEALWPHCLIQGTCKKSLTKLSNVPGSCIQVLMHLQVYAFPSLCCCFTLNMHAAKPSCKSVLKAMVVMHADCEGSSPQPFLIQILHITDTVYSGTLLTC